MSEVSASLVRELREKTGIGMMECKTALIESNGDIESAIKYLRKKGLTAAAKKASRTATEGLIGVHLDKKKASMVEINSETDFVSRNKEFQEFVHNISKLVCEKQLNLEELLAEKYPGSTKTTKDQLSELVLSIGENITIRRSVTLSSKTGFFFSYIHNAHPEYIETMYQEYQNDPDSIDQEWRKFFEGFDKFIENDNSTNHFSKFLKFFLRNFHNFF